jgi:hypothetical protein
MTVQEAKNRLEGTVLANLDEADGEDLLFDLVFNPVKTAADAMAADTSTIFETKAYCALEVVSVTVCPHAALTAHDTNHAVITLAKADGAGGAATAISALTTNVASGNWVADTFKNFPAVTAANKAVADGQLLSLKVTKPGSGVVVPASSYTIRCRKI